MVSIQSEGHLRHLANVLAVDDGLGEKQATLQYLSESELSRR